MKYEDVVYYHKGKVFRVDIYSGRISWGLNSIQEWVDFRLENAVKININEKPIFKLL